MPTLVQARLLIGQHPPIKYLANIEVATATKQAQFVPKYSYFSLI
jgi:hypothetical protein